MYRRLLLILDTGLNSLQVGVPAKYRAGERLFARLPSLSTLSSCWLPAIICNGAVYARQASNLGKNALTLQQCAAIFVSHLSQACQLSAVQRSLFGKGTPRNSVPRSPAAGAKPLKRLRSSAGAVQKAKSLCYQAAIGRAKGYETSNLLVDWDMG